MDIAQSGAQTSPFENQKEQVMLQLAERLINAYEKDAISMDEMREAADYILSKMEKVTNQEQLTYLLQNASHYWPIFKDVLVVSQSPTLRAEEQQVIEKLQSFLKSSSENN